MRRRRGQRPRRPHWFGTSAARSNGCERRCGGTRVRPFGQIAPSTPAGTTKARRASAASRVICAPIRYERYRVRVAEFSDGGSSWTEPAITLVVLGLAVAWTIALIPAILRSRREDEPVTTPPSPPEPSLEIRNVTLRWVFRYLGLSDDTWQQGGRGPAPGSQQAKSGMVFPAIKVVAVAAIVVSRMMG